MKRISGIDISKWGIWFNYQFWIDKEKRINEEDGLLYVWIWKRKKKYRRFKYCSSISQGLFKSLKEVREFWVDYNKFVRWYKT